MKQFLLFLLNGLRILKVSIDAIKNLFILVNASLLRESWKSLTLFFWYNWNLAKQEKEAPYLLNKRNNELLIKCFICVDSAKYYQKEIVKAIIKTML